MGILSAVLTLLLFVCTPATNPSTDAHILNMNGDYELAPTPKQDLSKFPKEYKDYPGEVHYFDIYSPIISTLYSQVYWAPLDPVPLPKEVIQNFDNKVMAVLGFEVDQVRNDSDGKEVSVPINVAYNHHFESFMIGKNAELKEVRNEKTPSAITGHKYPRQGYRMGLFEKRSSKYPSGQAFGASNGGEFRKSFHGFAPGQAKLIESPRAFQITPMQIDTWNRVNMSLSGGPFVPGPLPRSSLAKPGASYSGLLECPVTTRITKELDTGIRLNARGTCTHKIPSFNSCIKAINETGFPKDSKLVFKHDDSKKYPGGCSATLIRAKSTIEVNYNQNTNVDTACGGTATQFYGSQESYVNIQVHIDKEKDLVTLTLIGPAEVWFGVGFNAQTMSDRPWAVIAEGNGRVTEHQLEGEGLGSTRTPISPPSIKILSNDVNGDLRTVIVSRSINGKIFSFKPDQPELPFINAKGDTPLLNHHKGHAPGKLILFPIGQSLCVCGTKSLRFGAVKGNLVYEGKEKVRFTNNCRPAPHTDLLTQNNPTCDLRTYAGGQLACHHMWSLLDKDQDIPWPDKPLRYQLKFRFWYQEYKEDPKPSHLSVKRTTWGIASPVEYDVPECTKEENGCYFDGKNWIHVIVGTFRVPKLRDDKVMKLVAAHFHCHAPTCLEFTLYNNITGEEICSQKPIYGGTGRMKDPRFDETGYIAQPPCLWGSEEYGLEAPYEVSGKLLTAVKKANASVGHYGEMAWMQVLYIEEDSSSLNQNFAQTK